jgi:hypothetical protein
MFGAHPSQKFFGLLRGLVLASDAGEYYYGNISWWEQP